ncbi:granzyme-like protein 1 isoform X1 [Salarias fasciatus]|uniref:granzyme-like protein 1 isoform X1 n=1 Tax=Salarias fasciatus TaxID=181472 RepID=UPI001176A8CE|nr:granzyme-like protein 1 isoform X1 [Salarias fasciatus]
MTMIQISCIIYMFLLVSITGAVESNIVAGRVAKPHSRPYMASLQFNGAHSCGGILIREDFVLTAAHCKEPQEMMVVLGGHNISATEKTQQRIEVARYHQHPKFTPGQYEYDIMLLQLKEKAKLNKYVKTIGIPNKNGKTPANINCAVAGWGRTGDKMPPSDVLRETTEKIQFSFECKNIFQTNFNSEHMMCTKFDRKKGGVCQGDSGGPLICNKKVEGITAYFKKDECSNPRYPHVFTKVNYFSSWIKKVMQHSGWLGCDGQGGVQPSLLG